MNDKDGNKESLNYVYLQSLNDDEKQMIKKVLVDILTTGDLPDGVNYTDSKIDVAYLKENPMAMKLSEEQVEKIKSNYYNNIDA